MAEPKVFGFRKEPAQILKRVADREGLAPRFGSKVKYPKPLGGSTGVWIGKADAEIASDNSVGVTVSIWTGDPPDEEDSGDDLEDCFNRTSIVIDSGAWCKVTLINGAHYVEPLRCPA